MDKELMRADYLAYTNLAIYRRGTIINETILLERLIDDYIASYFCGEDVKKIELVDLVISTNRMIFENKVQVFKYLVEHHDKELIKKNPDMINDILNVVIPEGTSLLIIGW
jgi:hypothetical protein